MLRRPLGRQDKSPSIESGQDVPRGVPAIGKMIVNGIIYYSTASPTSGSYAPDRSNR